MIVATLLEGRQSPENPKNPLSANWALDYQSGSPTTAGARINEVKALNLSTVWAAVRVLTDTVASLPLITYQRIPGGGKDRRLDHRNWSLLHDRPCPEISAFNWFEALQGHIALWGNCYAEKQYNSQGYVEWLWPLTPNIVEPMWIDGMRWYRVLLPDNSYKMFPPSKMFHVPGFGFDGLKGYSPIQMARESLGLAAAAEEFGSRYFGQGTRPAGVLEHPEQLSKRAKDDLRSMVEEQSTGLSKMHRLLILEEGMKWSQTQIPPEESQFLETRQFQVEEVARWFKVPPHKIQHLLRATFSNIEHQSIEFVTETARPWLRRWEQVINWDLFTEAERSEFFSEFLIDGLLRGDSQARGEFYNKMFQMGAMSPNEIRESENRNPIEGGDIHLAPLNMVPLSDLDGIAASLTRMRALLEKREAPEVALLSPPQETRASKLAARIRMRRAHKRVLDDTARRVLNRELIQARRAIKASFGARNAGDFQRWLDGFYPDHRYEVSRRFDPVFLAYAESVAAAIDVEFTPEIEEFVREYAQTFGQRWAESSRGQLRDILIKGGEELDKELEARLGEWEETRPGKVANRESVRAGEAFSRVGYVAAGVTSLIWIANSDACDLCNEMDGRTVGHTDSFLEQGQTVNPGSDKSDPLTTSHRIAHPPLHDGCQCGVFPA